jgi:hypothetical protein
MNPWSEVQKRQSNSKVPQELEATLANHDLVNLLREDKVEVELAQIKALLLQLNNIRKNSKSTMIPRKKSKVEVTLIKSLENTNDIQYLCFMPIFDNMNFYNFVIHHFDEYIIPS